MVCKPAHGSITHRFRAGDCGTSVAFRVCDGPATDIGCPTLLADDLAAGGLCAAGLAVDRRTDSLGASRSVAGFDSWLIAAIVCPPGALDGPVLDARVYLPATNLIACLWGETAPFTVQARVPTVTDILLDRADRCGIPNTMATLAVVVEGPVQVASRQTWSLYYAFAP
jgi:hypothetical protein